MIICLEFSVTQVGYFPFHLHMRMEWSEICQEKLSCTFRPRVEGNAFTYYVTKVSSQFRFFCLYDNLIAVHSMCLDQYKTSYLAAIFTLL